MDRIGGNRLTINLLSPVYWSNAPLNRRLRSLLPDLAQDCVVDLGCGSRPYAPLYDIPHLKLAIGIDLPSEHPSERMLDDHFVRVHADASAIPLKEGTADLVLCTSVLEHVEDPNRTLSEAHRCLRAGGSLVLSIPFLYPVHAEHYDFRRFTPVGLRDALESVGLSEVCVEHLGSAAATIATLSNRWLWRFARGDGKKSWSKALTMTVLWPLTLPVIASLNLSAHIGEWLMPEATMSPMLLAIATKPAQHS